MVAAEKYATAESDENVLGSDNAKQMNVVTTANTIEQMVVLSLIVLKYFAPTSTCNAWINVLFKRKHTAVAYHTHLDPQNKCCPISQTLVKWGYAAQYSVIIIPVYNTINATITVTISPRPSPNIEYDHGNDIMAKQMYSENKSPAVFCHEQSL